jgi:group II intron reverse transcriptase/maturase
MSLESLTPGESRAPACWAKADERREDNHHSSAQNSGGVGVDGTLGSHAREGWEICGGGAKRQPCAQAGSTGEARRAAAEVGVLHSNVDLWGLDAEMRSDLHEEMRREGTRHQATKRSEGSGDGPQGILTPKKLRKLQIALYRKAKAGAKWRFFSLYGEICRWDILEHAFQRVARNGGAPGIDGESLEEIQATPESKEQWLKAVQKRLKTKTYRPLPVRRVYIAKSGGGQRGLGIPTVGDRVVQMALYLVLMPIFEADFHPRSFGFRPKRNAHQAIDAVVEGLRSGRTEVLDADLSKYFDTIPHRELMQVVAGRVSDGSILGLIKRMLEAAVVEEENGVRRITPNRCGTPQGGVISPLLANLYLNALDWEINEHGAGKPQMVRYADDFVILCGPGRGEEVRAQLVKRLEAKGLSLNATKTRIVDFCKEGFEFLGFTLQRRKAIKSERRYVHVEPSAKARQSLREKIREELHHWSLWRDAREMAARVNRIQRGWAGYFHYRNSSQIFGSLRGWTHNRYRRWLWRKHSCRRSLWKDYPDEMLQKTYGLWPLPRTAGSPMARPV